MVEVVTSNSRYRWFRLDTLNRFSQAAEEGAKGLKRIIIGLLTLLLLPATLPVFAIEKLELNVSVSEEHPFLPDYQFGPSGTLGDVWNLDVEVLDADGDSAEGAIVRFYLGTKSVGTGRVGFNGVAVVKLNLSKVGTQTFKVVASDSDPASKGESTFKLRIKEPKIERVFAPVQVIELGQSIVKLRPNPQLIMDAGCNDVTRFWIGYTTKYMKSNFPGEPPSATWPFTNSKTKRKLMNPWTEDNSYAQWIIDQSKDPVTDGPWVKFYDEPLGTQFMCQTDGGALVILK